MFYERFRKTSLPRLVCIGLATLICTAGNAASGKDSVPAAGRVYDSAGKPLPGVKVFVQSIPPVPIPAEIKESTPTLTRADGSYDAPMSGSPKSLVVFSKPGFVTVVYPFDRNLPEHVAMDKSDKLEGSVVDQSGKPLPGVELGPFIPHVRPEELKNLIYPFILGKTDEKGDFSVDGLARTKYDFLVRSSGSAPQMELAAPAPQKRRISVKTTGTTVTGSVTGSRDHLPKSFVYVQAVTGLNMRLFTKTDELGKFAFSTLPPREWTFQVVDLHQKSTNMPCSVSVNETSSPETIGLLYNQNVQITGRTLNAETSEPLAAIALKLMTEPPVTVQTNADGEFLFDDVGSFGDLFIRFNPKYIYVDPQLGSLTYFKLPLIKGDEVTSFTIPLFVKPTLSGKVVDRFSAPVADASVIIRSLSPPSERRGKDLIQPEFSATTDKRGQFSQVVYPPGPFEVMATAGPLVSKPVRQDTYTTQPGTVTVQLEASAAVDGVVSDAYDKPVAEALVELFSGTDQSTESRPLSSTKSGKQGEFSFSGICPQKISLVARHDSFAQPAIAGPLDLDPSSSTPITLKFPSGNDISCVVTDSSNMPLAEIEARVHYTYGIEGKEVVAKSGKDGRFEVRGLPVSTLERIIVRNDGYATYESPQITLPQKDYLIKLKRRCSITVTVEDPSWSTDGGKGVSIWLLGSDSSGDPKSTVPPESERFITREQGKALDSKAVFSNLEPGWFKIVAQRAPLYAETEPIRITGDEGNREVKLYLEAGGTLQGLVKDKATGQPIEGASVSITPGSHAPINQDQQSAVSDASGSYQLSLSASGIIKVVATAKGYPQSTDYVTVPAKATTKHDIVLSNETQKVSGVATYNGMPLENVLVVLYKATEGEPVSNAVTNKAGHYELSKVPPGTYTMSVEAPIGSKDQLAHKSYTLTVGDAAMTQDVRFDRLVLVKGRVIVKATAVEPAESTLLFSPKAGQESQTVPIKDGAFEAEMEPGGYAVGLEDRPGKDIEIPNVETYQLNLEF